MPSDGQDGQVGAGHGSFGPSGPPLAMKVLTNFRLGIVTEFDISAKFKGDPH